MDGSDHDRAPLDSGRLRSGALFAGSRWRRLEIVDETKSTNTDVADRVRDAGHVDEIDRLVVMAEHQIGGRGRQGRAFVTPPRACLTLSAVVRPSVDTARWGWLPLLTGLAVRDAVDDVGRGHGLVTTLKWPNDALLVDPAGVERKLGGILVERVDGPAGPAAVVGIGINVSLTEAELPVPHATSLLLGGVPDPDRSDLALRLLHRLDERLSAWESRPPQELRRAYEAACCTLGRTVVLELPDGRRTTGRAETVDAQGRLVVGGRVHDAGDVIHLRSATDQADGGKIDV